MVKAAYQHQHNAPLTHMRAREFGGLVDGLLEPGSATAIGLLLWGARHVAASEMTTYDSAPGGGLAARVRNAMRSLFP